METKENHGLFERATKQIQVRRGRLLHRRSKTLHSLLSSCTIPNRSVSKEESSEIENAAHNRRTRPASCVIKTESKPRPATALDRPKTVPNTKTKTGTPSGKNLLFVLGSGISSENIEERKDFSSSLIGRRRRTSSASHTRSRNPTSGSLEALSSRSRSGSKTALSRVPGLVKLSGSLKDFSEVENDDHEEERRLQLKEKFRHAVRLVSIFSAFCMGIKRYAEQEKSGQYDMYYLRDMMPDNEDKPTPIQESSLYFNKHLFSRDNTLHFPLWARWTCAQAPSDRSDAEINKLVTLLRGMKSFNKFSREAQWHLCRTMTYARYEKRRVIVRQGHPGFCFYFIVSGTVSVTVTRRDLKTGIHVTNTVDVLEKNDAFGEIALMTKDACRTATVICRERVEVLVVNRETVMEYCPDVFHKEFQEKLNILKAHTLFKRWDETSLEQLCYESHIKELAHGKLVDPDTTASDAVQFILRVHQHGCHDVTDHVGVPRVTREANEECFEGKVDMLRRLDLYAVIASKASINLCATLPLPRPTSAMPRKGKSTIQYVYIGSLYKNDAWDLRTTFQNGFNEPGNILVSAGVRLLKVPKQRIIQLSPHGALDEFEKNFVPNHRCPTNEELYQEYLFAQSWLEYRQKVVQNVIDCKKGQLIAHASCVSKGTSGWGPWPERNKQPRTQRKML